MLDALDVIELGRGDVVVHGRPQNFLLICFKFLLPLRLDSFDLLDQHLFLILKAHVLIDQSIDIKV